MAIGDQYQEILDITQLTLVKYAKRCGADFHVIRDAKVSKKLDWNDTNFEKFQVKDYLSYYDRIVFIDSDCLVFNSCVNLFDLVPKNYFGINVSMYNGFGFNTHHNEICKPQWESITGIDFVCGNSGVFVCDKSNKHIFDIHVSIDDLRKIHLGEQSYILSIPKYLGIEYDNFNSRKYRNYYINKFDKFYLSDSHKLTTGIVHFMGGTKENKLSRIKAYYENI